MYVYHCLGNVPLLVLGKCEYCMSMNNEYSKQIAVEQDSLERLLLGILWSCGVYFNWNDTVFCKYSYCMLCLCS